MRDDRVRRFGVEVLWETPDGYRYADMITADPDVGGTMTKARAFSVAATAGPPITDAVDVTVQVVERVYTRLHGSSELKLLYSAAVFDREPPLATDAQALDVINVLGGLFHKPIDARLPDRLGLGS